MVVGIFQDLPSNKSEADPKQYSITNYEREINIDIR